MSYKLYSIPEINQEKLLEIYESMYRIRVFEERVKIEFEAGKLPGFVHLYVGQESTAVGVCANLRVDDVVGSTHRGHGHSIAKGVAVKEMFAELHGSAEGLCKGKGGSMHVTDISKGMLGANAVVGASIPTATGAGLAFQYQKKDNVSVCFFGDGASNQGTFHESINLAAIWKLPVIYVCDNNGFAEQTPSNYHLSCEHVSDRAASYNIPGLLVDTSDVMQVYSAAKFAVDRARKGDGPTLIDSSGQRKYGHFVGDSQRYKSEEEKTNFDKYDPILKYKNNLLNSNAVNDKQISDIESQINVEIDEGWKFGQQSKPPEAHEVYDDVYVSYK